jgi:hypothetical protein
VAERKRLTVSQWQAHNRQLVRLPDGRLGRMQYVTPSSLIATVVVAGRRIRLPYFDLQLIEAGEYETFGTVTQEQTASENV